ncbi:DUF99 family protein [Candidatus Bathyarchaeota archaeon]|nr:MAG: DUF99 family protein [Candidatus Bathyarchaeota archaeon]
MEGRRRFAWGSRRELLPQALARTSLSRVFSPMHPAASINSNTSTRRIIGIDDGPFKPKRGANRGYAPLVAVWLQGPHLYKLKLGMITVDGLDATNEALSLLDGSHGIPILLSGVTFGGFNLIDPRVVRQRCKASVIVVVGSRPDNRAVKRALVKHFPDWKKRWEIIKSLGSLRRVQTLQDEPPLFYENLGCTPLEARRVLSSAAYVSRVPEPVRVAGLLGSGLFSQTRRSSG